jgi:polycystin 1L2
VVVCGFFTILYSFNYGLEVSMKWLCALIVAVFGDVIVTQPLKVLVIAFVFSFIFKKTVREQEEIVVEMKPADSKGECNM